MLRCWETVAVFHGCWLCRLRPPVEVGPLQRSRGGLGTATMSTHWASRCSRVPATGFAPSARVGRRKGSRWPDHPVHVCQLHPVQVQLLHQEHPDLHPHRTLAICCTICLPSHGRAVFVMIHCRPEPRKRALSGRAFDSETSCACRVLLFSTVRPTSDTGAGMKYKRPLYTPNSSISPPTRTCQAMRASHVTLRSNATPAAISAPRVLVDKQKHTNRQQHCAAPPCPR